MGREGFKRMKKTLITLLAAMGLLAGCGNMEIFAASEPPPDPMPVPQVEQNLFEDVDLVSVNHAVGDALVSELMKNRPNFHKSKPILPTTFVDLTNLDSSSDLGLIMAEQIAARFTQNRFTMLETRIRGQLAVKKQQGEFIMTRDIEKMGSAYKAFAVLTGTYAKGTGIIYITAKLVQLNNKQVLASVTAKIPMGVTTRDLLIESGSTEVLSIVNE